MELGKPGQYKAAMADYRGKQADKDTSGVYLSTQHGQNRLKENVVVREREFKSERIHHGNITSIVSL